jgi:hypothetical protein
MPLKSPSPFPSPHRGEGGGEGAKIRSSIVNYKKQFILLLVAFILSWSSASSGAVAMESLLPKVILEGWALIEGPRTYTKKTLFDHIDGQAELFLKYGFQKSVFAIYQNRENPNNQIELDLYDMGNVLHAFGVFSRFRTEGQGMGVGLDSYLDEHSALFYQGKYFVMLYSTESDPSNLNQFSMAVSSKITDPSLPPREIGYFPKAGLKTGSIQYYPEGLLGHQFLKRGFIGTYIDQDEVKDQVEGNSGNREIHLFIVVFKNSQEALNALKIYGGYLAKKGKVSSGSIIEFKARALKGEDPYQGKVVIVHKESYLLGVTGFIKEEAGENLLAELIRDITRGR